MTNHCYQQACETLIQHVAPRDDLQWKRARQKLIEQEGLNTALIDELHKKGNLYANILNIIFPHKFHGNGKIIGATLKPIEENSAWKTIGDKTSAWFVIGNIDSASTIVAVESPLEALRYHSYYNCYPHSAIVSCCGPQVPPPLMQLVKENEQKLILSFSQNTSQQQKKSHQQAKKWGIRTI